MRSQRTRKRPLPHNPGTVAGWAEGNWILQLASTCDVDRPPAASFREVERGGPARACGRDLRCQEAAAPAGWNSAGSQKHGEKHHASGGRAAGVAPRCAGEGRPGARAMSINPVCPSGDSLNRKG